MGPEWAAHATFGPAHFVPWWSPSKLSFKGRANFMESEWAAQATFGAAHFESRWSGWTNLDRSRLGSPYGPQLLAHVKALLGSDI